jgi:DNA modification methylase
MACQIELHLGDCAEVLRGLANDSVDAIVCDPPYGLSKEPDPVEVLTHWLAGDDYEHRGGGFMGKSWDSFVPGPTVWKEALRVLKPGGHLVAFFGTRTYDLGTLAIRLAGFEIRDQLAWMYAQGMPKSLNVGKQLEGWTGWGTALKPAMEPIVLARKPLSEKNIAANVVKWGTGALNIDGCRIEVTDPDYAKNCAGDRGHADNRKRQLAFTQGSGSAHDLGRWPANVLLDEESAVALDEQSGPRGALAPVKGSEPSRTTGQVFGKYAKRAASNRAGESGGASRFYFVAKPSPKERHAGVADANTHCTVKPIELMRHLIRLVCPPGGTVLDTFLGSGTTGCAAVQEDAVARFIGIELSDEYLEIARQRISHWHDLVAPVEIGEPGEQLGLPLDA